jgi:hypothetical protein
VVGRAWVMLRVGAHVGGAAKLCASVGVWACAGCYGWPWTKNGSAGGGMGLTDALASACGWGSRNAKFAITHPRTRDISLSMEILSRSGASVPPSCCVLRTCDRSLGGWGRYLTFDVWVQLHQGIAKMLACMDSEEGEA